MIHDIPHGREKTNALTSILWRGIAVGGILLWKKEQCGQSMIDELALGLLMSDEDMAY